MYSQVLMFIDVMPKTISGPEIILFIYDGEQHYEVSMRFLT